MIPEQRNTHVPFLTLLTRHGLSHIKDIALWLTEYYPAVTKEDRLALNKSGRPWYFVHICYARKQLALARLIEVHGDFVSITPEGRKWLQERKTVWTPSYSKAVRPIACGSKDPLDLAPSAIRRDIQVGIKALQTVDTLLSKLLSPAVSRKRKRNSVD